MTDVKPDMFNASSVFYRNVDQEPLVDLQSDQEYARPRMGEEPLLKWLGGDMDTGPWVYWVQLDAGMKAAPHKHFAPRIEYVLDGEIEFFEGQEALAWHRGSTTATSTTYGPNTLSYVPAGQLYGYEVTKPTTLLHVFFSNPVGHTEHFD